jgi:hypothetical protein
MKSLIQLDSLLLLSSLQLFRSTCVSNIPGVLPVVGFFIVVGVPVCFYLFHDFLQLYHLYQFVFQYATLIFEIFNICC